MYREAHFSEKPGTGRFFGGTYLECQTVPRSIALGEGCGQHEFGRPEFQVSPDLVPYLESSEVNWRIVAVDVAS
jgi:hypothetical protein